VNQQTLEIDPASRQRLTERFGHAVEGWFTQLPAVLVTLVDRWHLTLGEQIRHGSVSIVFWCRLADGRPAVLKLSPDRARIAEETAALRAWRTVHVPRAIGSDEAFGALLIEAVEPGDPLDTRPDEASAETVAELAHSTKARRALRSHGSNSGSTPCSARRDRSTSGTPRSPS
jgi:streptomycin 6-kinase